MEGAYVNTELTHPVYTTYHLLRFNVTSSTSTTINPPPPQSHALSSALLRTPISLFSHLTNFLLTHPVLHSTSLATLISTTCCFRYLPSIMALSTTGPLSAPASSSPATSNAIWRPLVVILTVIETLTKSSSQGSTIITRHHRFRNLLCVRRSMRGFFPQILLTSFHRCGSRLW